VHQKPFIKSVDPRARLLKKQRPDYDDDETRSYIENTGARLVAYEEHVEKSDDVLTPEELREREKR
jgi:hypothetical protein